jgi:hypothetical protein
MGFLIRMTCYLLLSVPFALLTWYFSDLARGLVSTIGLYRFAGPGELVRTALSFSMFLPWMLGMVAIAVFEASRSRSLIQTGIATVGFWISSIVVVAGFSLIGMFGAAGGGPAFIRIGLTDPGYLSNLISRVLHDPFGPHLFTGTPMPFSSGMWHLHGLIGPLFFMGMLIVLALVLGYAIGHQRQRHT